MPTYKPPLGVKPHWFVHRQRIEELNEAISRFLEHMKQHPNAVKQSEYFKVISLWAMEIQYLALMESELEKGDFQL